MWRSSATTGGRMPSKNDDQVSRSALRARWSPLMWVMLGVAAAALVAFPPVRIHRYDAAKAAAAGVTASSGKSGSLSPADAAQRFWSQQLVPVTAKAAHASEVIATLRA